MPRPSRFDAPGETHHLFNRGIARRPAFESRRDVRLFLALLAREAREGRIRVEAYSILTTHFHLLVQSPNGELSAVMQRVMNLYVRGFNRRRRRDGPLFRARFGSRVVRSEAYRRILVRYIDQNAPQARLAATPGGYQYGSAAQYSGARRPPWLWTDWVDRRMGCPLPADRPAAYVETFGAPLTQREARLVATRLRRPPTEEDDLDDLVGAAPAAVRDWMRRKALLADGTLPGQSYAEPASVLGRLKALSRSEPSWLQGAAGRKEASAWPLAEAGLLRDLSGLTTAEIARRARATENRTWRRIDRHHRLLTDDAAYAGRIVAIAQGVLASIGA